MPNNETATNQEREQCPLCNWRDGDKLKKAHGAFLTLWSHLWYDHRLNDYGCPCCGVEFNYFVFSDHYYHNKDAIIAALHAKLLGVDYD